MPRTPSHRGRRNPAHSDLKPITPPSSSPTDHASLTVDDLDAGVRFYRDAWGYELLFRDEQSEAIARLTGVAGLTCTLAQLRNPADGAVLELICFPGRAREPGPPRTHIALRVADLDTALAEAERHGARRLGDWVAFPTGRAVYVREPAGSVIELYEPAPSGAGQ